MRYSRSCPVQRLILYLQIKPAMSPQPPARQSLMSQLRSSTGPASFQRTLQVSTIRPDRVCHRSARIRQWIYPIWPSSSSSTGSDSS